MILNPCTYGLEHPNKKRTSVLQYKDHNQVYYGWKVVIPDKDGFRGEYYNQLPQTYNKWLTASVYPAIRSMFKGVPYLYEAGFHIFAKREDARVWKKNSSRNSIIVKVKFKYVMTEGLQIYRRVVVAGKMWVFPPN